MSCDRQHLRRRRLPALLCRAVLFLCLAAAPAAGKTLERYKEDIRHLKSDFAAMLSEETGSEFEREVFEEIPELLPAEDEIEVEGVSVDVNNRWLGTAVKRYSAESDPVKKQLILLSIYERLDAVELRIEELEAAAGRPAGKDARKRKLSEILAREEFQKPADEGESLLQRFINWLDRLLNQSLPDSPVPSSPSDFRGVANFLQITLYVLLAVLLGFLIYRFGPRLVRHYVGGKDAAGERIILGERIAPGENAGTLFTEAERLAGEGDLRGAIRKGYIALLYELSERRLIALAGHKTNRDYLRSVRGRPVLHRSMSGLTDRYERHWYGSEDARRTDWDEFRSGCREALEGDREAPARRPGKRPARGDG